MPVLSSWVVWINIFKFRLHPPFSAINNLNTRALLPFLGRIYFVSIIKILSSVPLLPIGLFGGYS